MSLALTVMVRNEADNITRCIDSARPYVDRVILMDTGSTDDTIDTAWRAAGERGLPIDVYKCAWRDFGYNRTALLEWARRRADWLLLLDADHTIEGELPRLAVVDGYHVRHAETSEYWVPRLIRADLPWVYIGKTHEYLAPTEGRQLPRCDLSVHHHAEADRPEKYARDVALLTPDAETDPRSCFYLAQSYRDMGEDDQAIYFYTKRARMGGWAEEVYQAKFEAAALTVKQDWPLGLLRLLEAWEYRSSRLEALYTAVVECRVRGLDHTALALARAGRGTPYPAGDVLHVAGFVYEHGLEDEYRRCLAACSPAR